MDSTDENAEDIKQPDKADNGSQQKIKERAPVKNEGDTTRVTAGAKDQGG